MADVVELSNEDMRRLLTAAVEAGGVDALLKAAAANGKARSRRQYVEIRNAGELAQLVEWRVITAREARAFVRGLPRATRQRRGPDR
jgi:hypothetical protein